MNDQNPHASSSPSQLFTVRVWAEFAQDGEVQMRMQVKHVLSGASRTFREWPQVISFITARLQDSSLDPTEKGDL